MNKFTAKVEIIGINPFVFLPEKVLQNIFKEAGKNKGKIPVKMKIEGHEFIQTLIKLQWTLAALLKHTYAKNGKKGSGRFCKI